MNLYPVSLKIKNRNCLVIGGGSIAERKVISLLNAGACVTVISPDLSDMLNSLFKNNNITYINRCYQVNDIGSYFIVIAATNSTTVNNEIFREAREKDILINCVDDPENCTFYIPSVIQRGYLQLTISSGGNAPYFTKKLREYLDQMLYEDMEKDLNEISELRAGFIKESGNNQETKKIMFDEILKPRIQEILEKFKKQNYL